MGKSPNRSRRRVKLDTVIETVTNLHASFHADHYKELQNRIGVIQNQAALDGLGRSSALTDAVQMVLHKALSEHYTFLLATFESNAVSLQFKLRNSDVSRIAEFIRATIGTIATMYELDLDNVSKKAGFPIHDGMQYELDRIGLELNSQALLLVARVRKKLAVAVYNRWWGRILIGVGIALGVALVKWLIGSD